MYPDRDWIYIAEALPSDIYPAKPYQEREWDVITFGRKYMVHHIALKEGNADGRIKYLFRDDGTLMGETHEDLLNFLANTRISVCAPRNPGDDSSGGVQAMTMRYLQSMACKCLVIGRTPPDMVDLFGYNPVIEADLNDAAGQIHQILDNWDDYVPLIEKNYETLMNQHKWKHWVVQISSILREKYGFDI